MGRPYQQGSLGFTTRYPPIGAKSLGAAGKCISLEWRKIARARINPKLKLLATEDYDKRHTNLFCPGFKEKALMKIEADRTIAKVAAPNKGNPPNKQRQFEQDSNDLRNFLSQGTPVQ